MVEKSTKLTVLWWWKTFNIRLKSCLVLYDFWYFIYPKFIATTPDLVTLGEFLGNVFLILSVKKRLVHKCTMCSLGLWSQGGYKMCFSGATGNTRFPIKTKFNFNLRSCYFNYIRFNLNKNQRNVFSTSYSAIPFTNFVLLYMHGNECLCT